MIQPDNTDPRAEPRTNMFLGAVIRGAGVSLPVKVRNMSASGALVEAADLPGEGAEVQLVRGSLTVSATIAWSSQGRCGLRFSSLACVSDWMAPPANAAQQRVDEAVRVLKLGAVPMQQRPAPHEAPFGNKSGQFGQDLRRVMRLIEDLGQELSSDNDAVMRRGEKLQNLDIALQTIAAVADGLEGGTAESAVAARLATLRASCVAALRKLPPAA